jgi:hypothetical protein
MRVRTSCETFVRHSWRWSLIALIGLASGVEAAWPPPEPGEAVIGVFNTTTFVRDDELVRAGVPIPRSRALLDTSGLALVDDNGTPVPASFTVLARWNAARDDAAAPVQWLLVRFTATLGANAQRNYRLRMDASVANPEPPMPLQLSATGNAIRIDTGVARFELGASAARVFDRIELAGGEVLSTDSRASARIDAGASQGFASVRRVTVEHADALSAVVIVEGEYAHPQIGGGAISGGRRLEFAAGSGAVTVREWIDWEGARCATDAITCGGGAINAVTLDQWRVALTPSLSGTRSLMLQSTLAQAGATATLAPGTSASLRQRRRADRLSVQRFEVQLPAQPLLQGTRADAGVALLSGSNGALGLALRAMPDYEPQALRVLSDGSLVADLADDAVWVASRQGTFAEYRVGVYPAGTSPVDATADLWPALNAPLLGLPAAQWIAASRATDEFPVGDLPPAFASFDTALTDLIDRTIALRRDRGLEGLMTFGLFPRNWGNPVLSDEIDCGFDPTPADDADDPYWCGFWSDYHNTSASAVVAAWRYGDPRPLHALSHPAAMRQLHTQLIRCAPDDAFFYCGQLPTGYGAYRADFNSSHGYVENLILNYWMSGDRTILERLERGVRSYRGYLCPSRGSTPPGAVCAPGAPITDEFAGVNDRVATQFQQVFRFVGLAGDASYLDDWRSTVARFLTQNFALLQSNGGELGFTEPSGGGSTSIITGAGTYYTTQLWMASIYDFNSLYRLEVDSANGALGTPAITPSRARQAWARTLLAASNVVGDGSAAGRWPNSLRYTFTGARIGGTLGLLEPGWAPGPAPAPNACFDDCLYEEGKSTLSATLARSADDLDDPTLRALALDLTERALQQIAAQPVPMGKSPGEFFGRLTSAVARLSLATSDPDALFRDGFESDAFRHPGQEQ